MKSRQLPARRYPPPVDLTDAATVAVPAGAGTHFRVTIAGNRTLGTPTGASDGQRLLIEITQGSGGNHTITLDSGYQLGTDVASVTLSTSEGARDYLGVVYNAPADVFDVVAFVRGY